jgi:predicted amidophosphoribosyltransferase
MATADLESQEPLCPECKAEILYECVACGRNNYPPQRTWVGLTDDEFNELYDSYVPTACYALLIEEVEAKLKEKNT